MQPSNNDTGLDLPTRVLASHGISLFGALALLILVAGPVTESLADDRGAQAAGLDSAAMPPLPEGVDELPEDRRRTLEPLVAEAVRYRGLSAGPQLPVGWQTKESLGAYLDRQIEEEVPEGMAPLANRVIEIFGWIPGEVDLLGTLRNLLGEQVAGYFDPATGYLVIVEGGMDGVVDTGEENGEEGGGSSEEEMMNDAVMIHEIGHYLQHRHFDLEALMEEEDDQVFFSDAAGARAALVEGDATHLMYSQMLGVHLENIPNFLENMAPMLMDPDALASLSPDLPESDAMAQAPTFLREEMVFPYMGGLVFVTSVRDVGGQALLDHAFAHDVPTSTEQILHPEKWLGDPQTGQRDLPVQIELPALEGLLGKQLLVGTWGELDLRIGLRVHLGDEARERAETVAAGWGGDLFALHENAVGEQTLVWITEWDTPADAQEMEAAAREIWTEADGWTIAAEGTRVVLIHGQGPAYVLGAVRRALLGTRAHRPMAPALDLAALGMDPADLPVALSPNELMTTLQESPFGQAMGGDLSGVEIPENLDMDAMLEDPEFREMARKASEEALRQMSESGPLEAVETEGRWLLPQLGIALGADAGSWTSLDLDAYPTQPKPSLLLTHELGSVVVVLAIPGMPAGPPEALVAGMRLSLPSFELVEQRELEGPLGGVELDYTFDQEGARLRSLHRYYYLEGSWLFSVQGMAGAEGWEQAAPAIDRLLQSIAAVDVDTPGE